MSDSLIRSKKISCPHGFSTRLGGVSRGVYESLNLGMNRGDEEALVKRNWDIFLEACGIPNREFVCGKQVHGNVVHIADRADMRPAYGEGELIEADGYVTNLKNVPLAIFTADCTPLLMYEPRHQVIAAVHCGWRSTVADIMGNAVEAMVRLGAEPRLICAATGPSICPKCFEVGSEVIEAVDGLLISGAECASDGAAEGHLYTPRDGQPGKYLLNLPGVVECRLLQLGLQKENIDIINECTLEQPGRYWSHRYASAVRGSQANVICLDQVK